MPVRRTIVLGAVLALSGMLAAPNRVLAGNGEGWVGGVAVNVADLSNSVQFYQKAFGLKPAGENKTPTMEERLLSSATDTAGSTLVLVHGQGQSPNPQGVRLIFFVDDLEASLKRVSVAGGGGTTKPSKAGSMMIAFARDPDGYLIEIIQKLEPGK